MRMRGFHRGSSHASHPHENVQFEPPYWTNRTDRTRQPLPKPLPLASGAVRNWITRLDGANERWPLGVSLNPHRSGKPRRAVRVCACDLLDHLSLLTYGSSRARNARPEKSDDPGHRRTKRGPGQVCVRSRSTAMMVRVGRAVA